MINCGIVVLDFAWKTKKKRTRTPSCLSFLMIGTNKKPKFLVGGLTAFLDKNHTKKIIPW